ncbi:hypothetical protein C8J57DRAFT_1474244 [Mycena rebaudengoi]|nr:hypothetical protein C8J57DRAFT_1474244 [Mycena rebaudengoi]
MPLPASASQTTPSSGTFPVLRSIIDINTEIQSAFSKSFLILFWPARVQAAQRVLRLIGRGGGRHNPRARAWCIEYSAIPKPKEEEKENFAPTGRLNGGSAKSSAGGGIMYVIIIWWGRMDGGGRAGKGDKWRWDGVSTPPRSPRERGVQPAVPSLHEPALRRQGWGPRRRRECGRGAGGRRGARWDGWGGGVLGRGTATAGWGRGFECVGGGVCAYEVADGGDGGTGGVVGMRRGVGAGASETTCTPRAPPSCASMLALHRRRLSGGPRMGTGLGLHPEEGRAGVRAEHVYDCVCAGRTCNDSRSGLRMRVAFFFVDLDGEGPNRMESGCLHWQAMSTSFRGHLDDTDVNIPSTHGPSSIFASGCSGHYEPVVCYSGDCVSILSLSTVINFVESDYGRLATVKPTCISLCLWCMEEAAV